MFHSITILVCRKFPLISVLLKCILNSVILNIVTCSNERNSVLPLQGSLSIWNIHVMVITNHFASSSNQESLLTHFQYISNKNEIAFIQAKSMLNHKSYTRHSYLHRIRYLILFCCSTCIIFSDKLITISKLLGVKYQTKSLQVNLFSILSTLLSQPGVEIFWFVN